MVRPSDFQSDNRGFKSPQDHQKGETVIIILVKIVREISHDENNIEIGRFYKSINLSPEGEIPQLNTYLKLDGEESFFVEQKIQYASKRGDSDYYETSSYELTTSDTLFYYENWDNKGFKLKEKGLLALGWKKTF